MKITPILLSKKQVAEALNVSQRTVDTLIAAQDLAVIRIGRRVLIARETLEQFARRN